MGQLSPGDIAQSLHDMRIEESGFTLPGASDPWVRSTFTKEDGSFDPKEYGLWLRRKEEEFLGPIEIGEYEIYMSLWLGRLVQESNMFYNGINPMLASYYKAYDEVPWEDWYVWGVIASIYAKLREEKMSERVRHKR